MAGELFLEQFEAAIEVTPGTPVASTRQMYFDPASKLTRQRDARPHKFTTGTRDNVRAFTLGPQKVAGQLSLPMSFDEIVELCLIGIQGGVTAGESDQWGYKPLDRANPTTCYDIHATLLHLLGIDHTQLTVRHNGIDRRLTDVHGQVIRGLVG